MLGFFPVGDEIRQSLRLDRFSWLVLDVMDADFDDPLGDSSSRLTIADDILQRCRGNDRDRVLLEVVRQAPLSSEDRVYQLLVLGVPLARLGEDLADVVHRSMYWALLSFLWSFDDHDDTDDALGSRDVNQHGFFVGGGGE